MPREGILDLLVITVFKEIAFGDVFVEEIDILGIKKPKGRAATRAGLVVFAVRAFIVTEDLGEDRGSCQIDVFAILDEFLQRGLKAIAQTDALFKEIA